jgi:hypothetical protein
VPFPLAALAFLKKYLDEARPELVKAVPAADRERVFKTYHPRGNALYAEAGEAYRAAAAALKEELLRKWQNLATIMKGAKDE